MITPFKKMYGLMAVLSLGFAASQTQAAICSYKVDNDWGSGFVASVTITNNGATAINGWNVSWQYTSNNRITNLWNATLSGSNPYSAKDVGWNGTIQPGQSINFGFQGNSNGSAAERPVITGAVCGAASSAKSSSSIAPSSKSSSSLAPSSKSSSSLAPSSKSSSSIALSSIPSSSIAPSSIPRSSVAPSSIPSSSIAPSSKSSSKSSLTCPPDCIDTSSRSSSSIVFSSVGSSVRSSTASVSSEGRMDNPFVGAKWYVNQDWANNAIAFGGADGAKIAKYNTAVWMDRIGAIAPTDPNVMGLRGHLDAALDQGANTFLVVVYDLPNRDCFALASNGELKIKENGFNRYKNEYITPLAAILADPKYRSIRIVAIIEPDSLPNLVTNSSDVDCQEASGAGGYVEATQFTLNTLYPISNVYSYIDIAHSGWLGWDENFGKATTLIANAIKGTTAGVNSIAGFISNTANGTPLKEPFLDSLSMSAMPGSGGGTQVRQAKFYEWNPMFSEVGFVQAWRTKMISLGFPSTIGMLVDTSRNGWGGVGRPTAVSTSTNVDTFVDQSRIDRRVHRGMWCNQPSGIGERPQVAPEAGIDAYVWVKPPGESDGVATAGIIDPTDPAKGFDRFCDPTFIAPGSGGQLTGAMANAPHAGRWFTEGFKVLLKNAYPAL